jgi:hypothetical protein
VEYLHGNQLYFRRSIGLDGFSMNIVGRNGSLTVVNRE